MRHLVCAVLLLLLACTAAGDEAWAPFVIRAYDGREAQGQIRTVAVPEHRGARGSRWIRVAVVRLPRNASARADASPIVFLSGGPGIPATALARVPVYFDLFETLRSAGDVLLIDQRGSGMSSPNLTCPEANIPADFLRSDARMRDVLADRVRQCATYWTSAGADLAGYSTREIAADVDAARRAIGAKTIKLLAFSYGSEVAFEILRRWPRSVDRVVFASTRAPDTLLKSPAVWDRQLETLGLLASAKTVVERLDREPTKIGSFEAGGLGVLTLLRADVPDGRATGKIASWLNGPADALAPRIQQIHDSLAKSFNLMTLAVDCASGWSPARLASTRAEAATAVMRNVNLQWDPEICAAFGGAGTPPPIGRIATPSLFITGTLDPNAPIAQTDAIRRHFAHSTHFIVEKGSHETLPSAEVQDIVVKFLSDANPPSRRLRSR